MSNISDLRFDDKNFNLHTQRGMGLLEKSLQQFGAGRSILIDKDNNIIAGNGIVEAAGTVGLEDVQIVESDGKKIIAVKRTDISLDSPEGREMALADNATAAADLEWDKDTIGEYFEPDDVAKWDIDIDWDSDKEIEEDEAPEVDESEPPKSELGKIYQLGNHRLMCGDSTDAGSVAILMDGEKADMVFTDPPYGVKRDKGFGGFGGFEKPIARRTYEDNWDSETPPKECFDSLLSVSAKAIIWGGNFLTDKLPVNGFWIFWDKNNTMPSFGDGELAWTNIDRHSVKKYDIEYNGLIGKEKERLHPTQKPIKLLTSILNDFTQEGDSVLDAFGGSGSTLIACEQLGRKCYMIELDPKYCDVIRKRYWKLTHDGNEEGWEEGTPAL